MKRMITATTVALACLSATPVTLMNASNLAAYAAEVSCESSSPASSGSSQQQANSTAHCNVQSSSTEMIEVSDTTQNVSPTPMKTSEDAIDDANRSYCPAIPRGASAEDFQYRAALARCKYGTRS